MFYRTLDVSRDQGATSLELHAAMSLSRLWQHKNEILYTQSLVLEDGERGLIWTSEAAPVSEPSREERPNVTSASTPDPRAYTPPHLVEKILTSHAMLQGERKQVTVLFCDLANSTGLAEQLGPEAMHVVLNQFFALALDAVH